MQLELIQGTVDRARQSFQDGKAKLYRSDGQPIYAPEEQQEREAALLAAFDAVVEPVYTQAEQAAATARDALDTDERDPVFRATTEEQQRAGALLTFIPTDPTQFADQARAAMKANDRSALLAFHHVGQRLQAEHADDYGRLPDIHLRRLRPVIEITREITTALSDPKASHRREQATATLKNSQQVMRYVRESRTAIDGSLNALYSQLAARSGHPMTTDRINELASKHADQLGAGRRTG